MPLTLFYIHHVHWLTSRMSAASGPKGFNTVADGHVVMPARHYSRGVRDSANQQPVGYSPSHHVELEDDSMNADVSPEYPPPRQHRGHTHNDDVVCTDHDAHAGVGEKTNCIAHARASLEVSELLLKVKFPWEEGYKADVDAPGGPVYESSMARGGVRRAGGASPRSRRVQVQESRTTSGDTFISTGSLSCSDVDVVEAMSEDSSAYSSKPTPPARSLHGSERGPARGRGVGACCRPTNTAHKQTPHEDPQRTLREAMTFSPKSPAGEIIVEGAASYFIFQRATVACIADNTQLYFVFKVPRPGNSTSHILHSFAPTGTISPIVYHRICYAARDCTIQVIRKYILSFNSERTASSVRSKHELGNPIPTISVRHGATNTRISSLRTRLLFFRSLLPRHSTS